MMFIPSVAVNDLDKVIMTDTSTYVMKACTRRGGGGGGGGGGVVVMTMRTCCPAFL